MKLAVTYWPQNGIGIERGPIVYSLPIKENWTPRVEPKFTTEEFPSWEATPASEWNYGLALDPGKLESEVRVENNPGPAPGPIPGSIVDPWENPPATLSVPARKIEGWELQANPDQPEQKFTPPLPDLSLNRPAGRSGARLAGSVWLNAIAIDGFPCNPSLREGCIGSGKPRKREVTRATVHEPEQRTLYWIPLQLFVSERMNHVCE